MVQYLKRSLSHHSIRRPQVHEKDNELHKIIYRLFMQFSRDLKDQ